MGEVVVTRRPTGTLRIEGGPQACVVCGRPAEPSAVGTPTCSDICTAILAAWMMPAIGDDLRAHPSSGVVPTPRPPRARPRLPEGAPDVERARARLGDCRRVFERHRIEVHGRMVRCPFHEDHHPSLSLYERNGIPRWHCFGCGIGGDALDLEAHLSGETVGDTIRWWGR